MSTTSQKHRDFVAEPMGDKPVTALSGIGDVLGKKLTEQGFDKVSFKTGYTMVLGKDYVGLLDFSCLVPHSVA